MNPKLLVFQTLARRKGLKLSDNAEKILTAIERNNGCCPCNTNKTPCPCTEIDKLTSKDSTKNSCHCGLFTK